jgi:hypothetical protein
VRLHRLSKPALLLALLLALLVRAPALIAHARALGACSIAHARAVAFRAHPSNGALGAVRGWVRRGRLRGCFLIHVAVVPVRATLVICYNGRSNTGREQSSGAETTVTGSIRCGPSSSSSSTSAWATTHRTRDTIRGQSTVGNGRRFGQWSCLIVVLGTVQGFVVVLHRLLDLLEFGERAFELLQRVAARW